MRVIWLVLILGCAAKGSENSGSGSFPENIGPETDNGPLLKQDPPKKPKGQDQPGDEERRKKFLESKDADGAAKLVETNNPKHIDAVAAYFADEEKSLESRLVAIRALRILREQDEEEYKRVYPVVKEKISKIASRGMLMTPIKDVEAELIIEALGWHGDMAYEHAMYMMENYLDPDVHKVQVTPIPESVRIAAALNLAKYPKSKSAREWLWIGFNDIKEPDKVRAQTYESLKVFHPKDLKEKILAIEAPVKDLWLLGLQKKLREEK